MQIEQPATTLQQQVLERVKSVDFSWEEACEMGLAARRMRNLSNWVIGQIAKGIEAKWGEDRLGEFASLLGFKKTTILQYRWVIDRFPTGFLPDNDISWTIYRLAAGTENPQQTVNEIIDKHLFHLKQAEQYVKKLPLSSQCHHDFEKFAYYKCKNCNYTVKDIEEDPNLTHSSDMVISLLRAEGIKINKATFLNMMERGFFRMEKKRVNYWCTEPDAKLIVNIIKDYYQNKNLAEVKPVSPTPQIIPTE